MLMLKVSLLFLLLCLSTNVTTDQRPNPLATLLNGLTHSLIRMEKKAQIDYTYTYGGYYWKPYPSLALQFELQFDQEVHLKYHIVSNGNGFLCTRLIIDGKQNIEFRVTTGTHFYHSNSASEDVYLTKGRHQVKVEFRSSYSQQIPISYDYVVSFLKAKYYRVGAPIPQIEKTPKKMTKKAQARQNYRLQCNSQWYQFSDLILTVDLQYDQEVEINYHIVTATNPSSYVATQVKIDNKVNQYFNGISWNNNLHSIKVIGQKVWLKKGAHFFQLEYKTEGNRDVETGKEFQQAYMVIVYYRK